MSRVFGMVVVCAALVCGCDARTPDVEMRTVQQWRAPDANLGSDEVRLTVVDVSSGQPLRATFCPRPAIDTVLFTDSTGTATLKVNGSGNLRVRIWAPGYAQEGLTFMPGRRGRMQVTVRLAPDSHGSESPSCEARTATL